MKKPPRTLQELETPDGKKPKFQFGLGKLIIVSNVLGVIVAVVFVTNGTAIAVAFAIAMLIGYLLPLLVFSYIGIVQVKELIFGRPEIPLTSEIRSSRPSSPFDD